LLDIELRIVVIWKIVKHCRIWINMRAQFAIGMLLAAGLAGPWAARCGAQATLAWNPSPDTTVAGYNLCWGTNSGNYIYTNAYPSSQTNATVTNLAVNQVYFFAVQAFATDGLVSEFSNEAEFTNTPPSTPPLPPGDTNGPPGLTGNTNGQSPTGSNSFSSSNITQSLFWGVPPLLTLALGNGQANLNIGATVGATLMIQSTTNPLSMDEWIAVTNLAISNIASVAQTNAGQSQDILDVAFVPGTGTLPVAASNSAPLQFFRAIMPYDYVILADQVLLATNGYTPRLIVVNMPGIVSDDACYVNEVSSFIHFAWTNDALQLEPSGSTIRQIATTLANSLNLDWTSASEFTYSNGLGQILATVIETESPSSDPVAGQNPPGPPIVIDF
jgi:hypothetical protein